MKKRPVLACITAQPHCVSIIENAKRMAKQLETGLVIVTAQPRHMDADSRAQSVKCLNRISKECGVDIIVRYSDSPAASIALQAFECNPVHVFIGEDNGFLGRFRKLYGFAPISMVTSDIVCTIPAELDLAYSKIG